ncbi:hypothetical protein PHMEG_00019433 [Phytophthora megakarya]|uniref:Uncharacterized protein n=1 Tax=Phytophthora megakarya TaxID=4795 RepID=A0A225VSE9_9STRA|nr:hypothetical protein PHMEG_00019433 [Phytophthora megakarya]
MKQLSRNTEDEVFGSKGTPYVHDPHMIRRPSRTNDEGEIEVWKPTPSTRQDTGRRRTRCHDLRDDSSDSDSEVGDADYLEGDLTEKWSRHIRELSRAESKYSTPRREIATHVPLGT